MPNNFTPKQVAEVAANLINDQSVLGSIVNRSLEAAFDGGKGTFINVKVPAALTAHDIDIDNLDDTIKLDTLGETTFPIEITKHAYSAVKYSEKDERDIETFAGQVLAPQSDAVVDYIEHAVIGAFGQVLPAQGAAEVATIGTYDAANPLAYFTRLDEVLTDRGVPARNRFALVGTTVYADMLNSKVLSSVADSGNSDALRNAIVGSIVGFQVLRTNRIGKNEVIAFHRDAVTLITAAPDVPEGVFGTVDRSTGYAVRAIKDYDLDRFVRRSVLSTFVGASLTPFKRVTRDYAAGTATVENVAGGAAIRVNTAAA